MVLRIQMRMPCFNQPMNDGDNFMKKVLLVIFFLIIVFQPVLNVVNVYAEEADLMPLNDIIDIEFNEAKIKYPELKIIIKGKNDSDKISVAYLEISGNSFWDSAVIKVENGKILTCSLVKTKDSNAARNNVPKIIKIMVKKYGKNFARKVNTALSKKGKLDSPLLVWEGDDRLFAFTFTPLDYVLEKNEIFGTQLTILSKKAEINKELPVLERTQEEKRKIFEQIEKIIKNED